MTLRAAVAEIATGIVANAMRRCIILTANRGRSSKKTFKRGVDTDPPSNYNTDMTNTAYNIATQRANQNWELQKNTSSKLSQERKAALGLRCEVMKAINMIRWNNPETADKLEAALALHKQEASL